MAISFVQGKKQGIAFTANTGASITQFASNVAVRDLIVCSVYLQNVSAAFNPVITDGVNSGNYIVDYVTYDSTDGALVAHCHMVCNAVGKPTVTIAGSASYTGGNINALHFTGFTYIPTFDASLYTLGTGTGTAPTASLTTTHTPELVVAELYDIGGSAFTQPSSPWSDTLIGGAGAMIDPLYQLAATSGASVSYTASLTTSGHWYVALIPFFDNQALTGTASDTTTATGALTSAINLAAAAANTVTAAAQLTGYSTVTLAGTLYTGVGGILDPNFWAAQGSNIPALGDTLYYDPTFITIQANGEIVSTSNNCSSLVQFNDGTGWAVGLVVIVPTMAASAYDTGSTASGSLTTGSLLAAAASTLVSASAALSTRIPLAGGGSDVDSASAALSAAIGLAGAALDTTSATGGALHGVAAVMAGNASDSTSAAGTLTAQVRLAGAALDLTAALAALTTSIQLAGAGIDSISASGKLLSVGAALGGGGADTTSALASLTTHLGLAAAARDLTSASASITAQIALLGAALDATTATGNLTAGSSPAGVYSIDPNYVIVGHRDYATQRLPSMAPTEERVITFNFADDLENGETLTGVITVSVACSAGIDVTPDDILNGYAAFSADLTEACQPVIGTVANNDYYITVTAKTTNPQKVLSRFGILPIRA